MADVVMTYLIDQPLTLSQYKAVFPVFLVTAWFVFGPLTYHRFQYYLLPVFHNRVFFKLFWQSELAHKKKACRQSVCLVVIDDLWNLSVNWELIDLGCSVCAQLTFSFGANDVPAAVRQLWLRGWLGAHLPMHC